MKTVRETEFPRIQMFMHSYTGATKWESEFKNISQMSTINQVTKDYPSTYLSVGDPILSTVKILNFTVS